MSNRPRKTTGDPFLGEEKIIEISAALRIPPRKERPTLSRGIASSGRRHTLRLRARVTISKISELMKGIHKLMKTKQTPRSTDADVHRGFDDKLVPYMLGRVKQNAEEVWIHLVDKECINPLRSSPYFRRPAELDAYGYVTPFLDAVSIRTDHHANVFLSQTQMFYLHNMALEAAGVKPMFHSGIFDEGDALKEVWWHRE